MSISKKGKVNAPRVLKISDFFGCQNQRILLWSEESEPAIEFFSLPWEEEAMMIALSRDSDHVLHSMLPTSAASMTVAHWATFSLLVKKLVFPLDFLFLDRVDTWDLGRSKRDVGRIRKPILLSLTARKLQGTNVIITRMGYDVGLAEQCHRVIEI